MNRYTRWDTKRALEVIKIRCGVRITERECGTLMVSRLDSKAVSRGPMPALD